MTTLMDVPAVTGQYEATARPAHWGGVLAMTLPIAREHTVVKAPS